MSIIFFIFLLLLKNQVNIAKNTQIFFQIQKNSQIRKKNKLLTKCSKFMILLQDPLCFVDVRILYKNIQLFQLTSKNKNEQYLLIQYNSLNLNLSPTTNLNTNFFKSKSIIINSELNNGKIKMKQFPLIFESQLLKDYCSWFYRAISFHYYYCGIYKYVI